MKKLIRRSVVSVACLALLFGAWSIVGAGRGTPAPPPPVLCGCACPDGSFVIVHAPDENSCPTACESACGSEY